jgi:hypothetical protein
MCKIPKFRINRLLLSFIFLLNLNCADIGIGLGPSGPPNDATPSGTLLRQSQFNGLNGKTASGAAIFYSGNGAGNYILRLEGVSFPEETGLAIRVYSASQLVSTLQLRSSSGSQNYTLSGVGTQLNFSIYGQISVYIFSNVNNKNYALAM